MATHVAFHEVDDVDHWLGHLGEKKSSGRWESRCAPFGIRRVRPVGLIAEIPDMAAFQAFMQTERPPPR